MIFVEKVRRYRYNMSIEEAVTKAANECIEEDVLKDILLTNKAEIMKSCLTEFNQKKYDAMVRKELREEIAEKDKMIAEQTELLADKDELLADKDELLASKDEMLATKAEMLASKDEMLAEQEKLIAELKEKLKIKL